MVKITTHTQKDMTEMNAEIIRERIDSAMTRAGRTDRVYFAAVSKTRTVEEMHEAERISWVDFFGENRVQEGEMKRKVYGETRVLWRLIGHLQANKARKAIEIFDTIDSVDSIDLATRLNRIAGEMERVVPILIEVNTSGEASKSGINTENFTALLDAVMTLDNLRLDGLMTVGPITDDEGDIRRSFAELRGLADDARTRTGLSLPVLSMGMSGDFELAILEGSTMIRIGTLLFGPRDYTH